ncbi:MAG: Hsp70 family protein [Desulfobacterales bacterium]
MSKVFGLDFGTSNSALSVNIDGKVQLLDIDKDNPVSMTLKSVLYFHNEDQERNVYAGHEAVQNYIDTGGEGRFLQSIKSFLPDSTFEKTEIYKKNYTIEQLISFILKKIKVRGEEIIGAPVDDLILGRPVVFSEDKENDELAERRLIEAAKMAGFKNIKLQLEPIAAALNFENGLKSNEEKKILVGDFGGGTSDFTILKVNGHKYNRSKDVLATGGVPVGGDTFDSEIMWGKVAKYFGKDVKVKSPMSGNWSGLSSFTMGKLRGWHLIPLLRAPKTMRYIRETKYLASDNDKVLLQNLEDLIDYNFGYLLFQSIEKSKCELSASPESTIAFNDYEIDINDKITKFEFEEYIEAKIEELKDCVNAVLSQAGLTNNEIDIVSLTGGSSFIPIINKIFAENFGIEKVNQSDAFTSVAHGLGVYSTMI